MKTLQQKKLTILVLVSVYLMLPHISFAQTYQEVIERKKSIKEIYELRYLDGVKAPDISTATDEAVIYGAHDYTLVCFWEPWCGPCLKEVDKLYQLDTTYNNLHVILISKEKRADVEKILKNKNVSFNVFSDGKSVVNTIFMESGYPRNYLIDKDGVIKARTRGYNSEIDPSFLRIKEILDGIEK